MGMPGEFCGDSSGAGIDPYMPGHRSDAGPLPVRYQLGVIRGPGYPPAVSAGPYAGHAYPGPAPPAPMPGTPFYHHVPGPNHGLHSLCGPGMHPAGYPPEPPMPSFARPPGFCDIPGCLCGAGQPLPPHISAAPSHLGPYSVTTGGPFMQHDVYEAVPGRAVSHYHLPQMPNMLEGSSSVGFSGLGGLAVAAVPPSIPGPGSGSMPPGPLAAAGLTPRHGSKKQSAKGRKGGAASGKGPGAASAMAVGKGAASGNKRKAEQPAATGPKISRSSEGQTTATSDGAAAQPKFNSLRTTNNQIKVQVLTLQLSKTDLLSQLTDLSGKWRSTVADNVQLQQDNAVLRDKIAKVKQQLAETGPSQQQQQRHERSSEPKRRLPWLPHSADLSRERVPRAQSV
eukprot:gene1691-2035_t